MYQPHYKHPVVTGQPMPVTAQPMGMGQSTMQHTTMSTTLTTNTWNSRVCDCCTDCGSCCFAFWCFPCFTCSTASKFGECCCLPILDSLCFVCVPAIGISMRSSIRERYGIHGSICDDCVIMYCCTPCGWCQIARELNFRQKPVKVVTQTTMII
uniref:Cornifelin homolog n=1 Tax=Petromyzon marinus TaxID=7757 RepID=A0AAJ7U4B4_PETMA|nr:cornifelin homolog [Petromyzon marinus]